MKAAILTVSDKGSRGERVDESGQVVKELLEAISGETVHYEIVPDEQAIIEERLMYFADDLKVDLVLTTGGTGFSPRDVTPEATLAVVQRLVPGLAEAMRHESAKITSHALLSRAVCGIRGQTLIVNLPGSPKGVRENLAVILPAIPHGIEILKGTTVECGTPGHTHVHNA